MVAPDRTPCLQPSVSNFVTSLGQRGWGKVALVGARRRYGGALTIGVVHTLGVIITLDSVLLPSGVSSEAGLVPSKKKNGRGRREENPWSGLSRTAFQMLPLFSDRRDGAISVCGGAGR